MRKKVFLVVVSCFIILFGTVTALAHPGRTDSNGGHWNRKTGTYHYHNGGGSSSKSSKSSSASYSVPKTVYATRVKVPNMPSSINAGECVKLNGSAYPANAEDKSITWESSDSSVAVVDSEGNLTAVGVGSVVISAKTSRGTTSKFNLIVKEIVAESIVIENKIEEIIIGETATLTVIFTPDNTTYKDIEWKSDDEAIVSVGKDGKLDALAVGKTTVTATHKELTDSFEIEVKPILAESVEISCINTDNGEEYEELRFEKGEEIELQVTVLPEDTTDASVKWSVNDEEIATVDQNGKLTMTSKGTVIVTAETSNGLTDEIVVEVYRTSIIVYIIAGSILFLIFGGIMGGVVFVVFHVVKKIKNHCF